MEEIINFDSDLPIQSSSDDKFGRGQFAHQIAEIILKRYDPASIVVGVTAPWGDGKTSVLNIIKERLAQENTRILDFNPWRFSNEDSLLRAFYFALAEVLNISIKSAAEKAGSQFEKYSSIASIPKIPGIDLGKLASGLAGLMSEATVEELKVRVEKALREKKERLVVLMDDIDRLDIDEVQAVFRLIKLSASFPYTAYIVSFDEERVAEALSRKYGDSRESGRQFLEKIIQVSLPLPPASSQVLLSIMIDGVNTVIDAHEIETSENEKKRFSEYFTKAFRPQIRSLRLVKRFVNGISFAVPILKGEVNTTDLIFLEAIKVFYTDLYRTLRENGEKILLYTVGDEILGRKDDELGKEINDAIQASLGSFSESSRSGIEFLLQDLFPGLSSLSSLSRPYISYNDEKALDVKRIFTREYFWRYFSYGIQPHDISDLEIMAFFQELPNRDAEFVRTYLNKYLSEPQPRFEILIEKLRLHEDKLTSNVSSMLALGLGSLSTSFPTSHPDDSVFGFGIRSQIAQLHLHLVQSLPESERIDLLKEIVRETPDLIYAYQLTNMMRSFGQKIDTSENGFVVVSNGIERAVNEQLIDRFKKTVTTGSFEESDFGWSQELYMCWFLNGADSLATYLERQLTNDVVSFLSILGAFVRFDVSGQKTFTFIINRNVDLKSIISSLIDVEKVANMIESEFLSDTSNSRLNKNALNFARELVLSFRNLQ